MNLKTESNFLETDIYKSPQGQKKKVWINKLFAYLLLLLENWMLSTLSYIKNKNKKIKSNSKLSKSSF